MKILTEKSKINLFKTNKFFLKEVTQVGGHYQSLVLL